MAVHEAEYMGDEEGAGSGTEDELLPGKQGEHFSRWPLGSGTSLSARLPASRRDRRRLVAVALGIVALAACTFLAVTSLLPSAGERGVEAVERGASSAEEATPAATYTVRRLLESPELAERASEQIMRANARLGLAARALVQSTVADVFRNVSTALHWRVVHNNGEAAGSSIVDASSASVSEAQRDAVLHVVRYLADPRVVSLGRDVVRCAKEGAASGLSRRQVLRKLAQELAQRRLELLQLRSEALFLPPDGSASREAEAAKAAEALGLLPRAVPAAAWPGKEAANAQDAAWERRRLDTMSVTFPPLSYAAAGASGGAAGPLPTASPMGPTTTRTLNPLLVAEDVLGIAGAACEEARCILDILRPLTKMFAKDMNVNPVVTSAIGSCSLILETASCELDGIQDGMNPLEMSTCPLQFGSAGMDALRQMFTLMGLQGDNNPKNGQQGYHPNADDNDVGPDDTFNPNDFFNFDKFFVTKTKGGS